MFRYTLAAGARGAFEAAVVSDGIPRLARDPDLRFALAGRSSDEAGVVVTVWDRFEAITEQVGGAIERPVFLAPAALGLLASGRAAHFEALDLPAVGCGEPAVLRIMNGDVTDWAEAGYFDWVRRRLWPTLGGVSGLAGSWAGRQVGEEGTDPVIGVTAWTSRDAVRAAGADAGPLNVGGDTGPFRFASVEVFDLFAVVPDVRPGRSRSGDGAADSDPPSRTLRANGEDGSRARGAEPGA